MELGHRPLREVPEFGGRLFLEGVVEDGASEVLRVRLA